MNLTHLRLIKCIVMVDEIDVDATGKKSVRVRLGASANGTVYANDEKIKFAATPAETLKYQNIVIKFLEEEK